MGEILYIDEMAGKKTERLQIVLSPEDLSQLDEWRRQQADLPNRSEAVRRLIGMKVSTTDWNEMQAEAEKIDVDSLGGRVDHLLGTALARAIVAMSEDEHPAFSDMTDMYALLTKRFKGYAWMMFSKGLWKEKNKTN